MLWTSSKEHLLTALARVQKVVASNPRSVQILQCVKLEASSDGLFVIATSNMANVKVQVTDAVVKAPGIIVVSLEKLKDRLQKTTGVVEFNANSTTLHLTSSEDQKLGIRLNDSREFPPVEWVEQDESYGLDASEVISLFSTVRSLAQSASALTPAFLQAKIEDQKIFCSSGVLYRVLPLKANPSLVARIPLSTLAALGSFIDEASEDMIWLSQYGADSVVVTVGQDQYQAVPLAVDFPSISPLISRVDIASIYTFQVDRMKLLREARRARSSADDDGVITLTIRGIGTAAAAHVKAESKTGDYYTSVVAGSWDGDTDRVLSFQADSLINFLNSYNDDKISIQVGSDTHADRAPIIVREGDGVGVLNQYLAE